MKRSFGYFQNEGSEFVVTEPQTPRALVNYAWNPTFISGVSQHGGGDGIYKERAIQYIDARGRALLVRDGQRYFYLRDEADGDVWSPGWHPVQAEVQDFTCTHGMGYSIIQSRRNGIAASLRWFVPGKDPCEIWTVTLTNHRPHEARLKFFSFVDFLLMGYQPYCDYYATLWAEFYAGEHILQCCNRTVERPHPVFDGFIASDTKPSGFDSSRRAFLGSFGYANDPQAVRAGKCRNTLATSEKLVGALEHTVVLAAGESRTFNIFIGASSDAEMTKKIVAGLSRPGVVEAEFASLKARKAELVNRIKVDTPNEHINYLINCWVKQQIQVYADVGSDNGRGFRDAMQLLWAAASYDADYVNRMLDECLRHQYSDGHTVRGWLPIDDHHYSDGPVWIAPTLDAYVKETGNAAVLDRVVPYLDKGAATIWEHCLQGLRHSSDDLGSHGLVRCHFGDWNDSLTGVGPEGRGESVWTSIAIVYSLKVAAEMAQHVRHNLAEAQELLDRAARLTAAIQAQAWDGQWYLRAFNDFGEKVGTHTEKEGYIYLLPQVWAIIAGIADESRRKVLFASVDQHLDSAYGSKTLHPPFTKLNMRIGRLTGILPGMWENGTPYCHSNGFKIIADCVGGRGNSAYQSYLKAMPDSPYNPSTHSGCEPYVFTNMYLGPEHARKGETQFAWMTGAGGWYYRALTEWILGVRADFNGLLVDPCLSSEWSQCTLERDFRGARYRIAIRNPSGLEKGVVALTVDGKPVAGNVIPIFGDGKLHEVTAELRR